MVDCLSVVSKQHQLKSPEVAKWYFQKLWVVLLIAVPRMLEEVEKKCRTGVVKTRRPNQIVVKLKCT